MAGGASGSVPPGGPGAASAGVPPPSRLPGRVAGLPNRLIPSPGRVKRALRPPRLLSVNESCDWAPLGWPTCRAVCFPPIPARGRCFPAGLFWDGVAGAVRGRWMYFPAARPPPQQVVYDACVGLGLRAAEWGVAAPLCLARLAGAFAPLLYQGPFGARVAGRGAPAASAAGVGIHFA